MDQKIWVSERAWFLNITWNPTESAGVKVDGGVSRKTCCLGQAFISHNSVQLTDNESKTMNLFIELVNIYSNIWTFEEASDIMIMYKFPFKKTCRTMIVNSEWSMPWKLQYLNFIYVCRIHVILKHLAFLSTPLFGHWSIRYF